MSVLELAPHFLELAQLVPFPPSGSGSSPDLRWALSSSSRDFRDVARNAVNDSLSGVTALTRRRVHDWSMSSQKVKLDASRYAAMSLALPRDNRSLSRTAPNSDRRRFNQQSTINNIFGSPAWFSVGQFRTPSIVGLCVHRKVRRQVLFAKRRHGGHHRPGRRTWLSNVRC